MDKNKAVLVEDNGKQLKYKLNDRTNQSSANKELAATLDDSDDAEDSVPVITGLNKPKKTHNKKQHRFHYLKPILIAVTSAIIIGSILGLGMLRLFVDVEGDVTGQAPNNNNPSTVTEKNEAASDGVIVQLDPLEAHILQAGIFSEKENAEQWSDNYAAEGIPTITWERDNQYFLIAGVANTKEDAKFLADELKKNGSVDLYVKEWATINGDLELTADEENWLVQFQAEWRDSLKNLSEQNTFSTEIWSDLLAAKPDQTEKLSSLLSSISNSVDNANHLQLLQWMYHYEQLAK
ncbi:SPOR domain-containing protein [Oceanobacillus rekensis]|uniref:SPOR domain-containing protein n=1 Tax=Oceanobacillus rekensis TaxID=937927 RepID=UPI001593FFB9|nr:SPOR domain-containing protein [Oceanobacillus rekensis]